MMAVCRKCNEPRSDLGMVCQTCFQASADHVTDLERGLAKLGEMVDRQQVELVQWMTEEVGAKAFPGQRRLQLAILDLHRQIAEMLDP